MNVEHWLTAGGLVVLALIVFAESGLLLGFFLPGDTLLFERANVFFVERGPAALVLARFVPIVRTFVPIVAGVARMDYRKFLIFNLVGACAWGVGITTLGYFLGEIDFVKHNLDVAAIAIAAVSLIPVVREIRGARAKTRA